jgi:hypothetical protein
MSICHPELVEGQPQFAVARANCSGRKGHKSPLLVFAVVAIVVLHFASGGRFLPIRSNERTLK